METFKNISIGFGIGIIGILLLYFFWFTPQMKSSYDKGRADCEKLIDTVLIPGKPYIEYRDTSFHVNKPPEVVKDEDSILTVTSKFDTTWISNKDTIGSHTDVKIEMTKNGSGKYDTRNTIANWFQNLTHKDYEHTPDTVKITIPKIVEVPVVTVNWLITGIAYVSGVISATILYFLAKK